MMRILKSFSVVIFILMATAFFATGCQVNSNQDDAWEDALLNSTEPTKPKETEPEQKSAAEALFDYFSMSFYGGADKLYNAAPEAYWQSLIENDEFTFEQAKDHVDQYAAKAIEALQSSIGGKFTLQFKTGNLEALDEEVQSQIITDVTGKYGLDPEKATDAVRVTFEISYGVGASKNTMYMLCYDGAWYPVVGPEETGAEQYTLAVETDMNGIRKMVEPQEPQETQEPQEPQETQEPQEMQESQEHQE